MAFPREPPAGSRKSLKRAVKKYPSPEPVHVQVKQKTNDNNG